MGPEKTLIEGPGLCPGEGSPPFFQFVYACGSFLHEKLYGPRVGKMISLLVGINKVLLPAIFRVHGAQRGIDPAGSQSGMGIIPYALAENYNFGARLVSRDSRA